MTIEETDAPLDLPLEDFLKKDPSPEELAFGNWLFLQECTFIAGSQNPGNLPPETLPEVAFAGRSNVGKSSLVNALTRRKTLARTSSTPGRTQQLNFFDLGGQLHLVDLPGYGYAEASKQKISQWTGLTKLYLKTRATLRRVFLLIDGRHGMKPLDHEICDLLDESAVSYQIVLTKIDKLSPSELAERVEETEKSLKRHPASYPLIVPTTSLKSVGLEKLRAIISAQADTPSS